MKKTIFITWIIAAILVPASLFAYTRAPGMTCVPQDPDKLDRINYDYGRYFNDYTSSTNTVCSLDRSSISDPSYVYLYGENYNGEDTTCYVRAYTTGGTQNVSVSPTSGNGQGTGTFTLYWSSSDLSNIDSTNGLHIFCVVGAGSKIYQTVISD